MPVISRSEAKSQGIKKYFTGKPCKFGHISHRYVSSFQCFECTQQEEHKLKKSAATKAWVISNPERAADNHRRKYESNKIAIRARIERWRKENMERANLSRKLRKHKVRAGGPPLKRDQIETLFSRQKWKCANCNCCIRNGYHIDHIYPVSKGGTNQISNIQLLCQPCNSRKSAKDPMIWAKENGRLL